MGTHHKGTGALVEPADVEDLTSQWFASGINVPRSILQHRVLAKDLGNLARLELEEDSSVFLAVQHALRPPGSDRPYGGPVADATGLIRGLGQGVTRGSHFRTPSPQELLSLVELRLAHTISESEYLLSLESDWDDAGSPGYAEQTWHRAVCMLVKIAEQLRDIDVSPFRSAAILPGPDGDIDLEVRSRRRRLLLSVPVDSEEPIQFFGHDEARTFTLKGMLNEKLPNRWLAEWLSE